MAVSGGPKAFSKNDLPPSLFGENDYFYDEREDNSDGGGEEHQVSSDLGPQWRAPSPPRLPEEEADEEEDDIGNVNNKFSNNFIPFPTEQEQDEKDKKVSMMIDSFHDCLK